MATKLSEKAVASIAVPEAGSTTVFDEEIRGFGVRVSPKGVRTFFLDYVSPIDGRERRQSLGRFGDDDGEETAKSARGAAKALRTRITAGEDPALTRAETRAAPTVRELAERYFRDHLPRKAARSQKEDRTLIEKEILPYKPKKDSPPLGDRKVADIHHGDMKALHAALTARGVPVRANRVLAAASKMFSLALIPEAGDAKPWRDRAQGNPCQGVERNAESGMERFLSTAELAALSDAIAAKKSTPAVNAVKLLMLTGARPGEALAATWDQFDGEPGWWVKGAATTKQRKVHRVPLTAAALELIEQVRKARKKSPRARLSPYVFPGQKPGEPIRQLRSTWEELSEAATVALWRASAEPKIAKLVADMERGPRRPATVAEVRALAMHLKIELPPYLTSARLYDLRHSFASVGAARGLSLQIIGRLLGHTVARTTMRYAHLSDDPLSDAAQAIGAAIYGAGKPSAEVLEMKRPRRR